jgi:outer membrane lipoprotein-sorting protein
MKKLVSALLLLIMAATVQAQTADEVINKYITALGGMEKLKSIKSIHMEGVSVMQNGNEMTTTIDKENGKLYRRKIDFGMGSMTFLVTEKGGWSSNPRSGGFEAMNEQMLKAQQHEMDCTHPLVDYAAKGHKVELMGKEAVEGADAYKIKLTLKSGTEIICFIDAASSLLIRETRKMRAGRGGGGGEERDVNFDYFESKTTEDGFLFPTAATMGGFGGKVNFEKMEVNKPVDASLYKPE